MAAKSDQNLSTFCRGLLYDFTFWFYLFAIIEMWRDSCYNIGTTQQLFA